MMGTNGWFDKEDERAGINEKSRSGALYTHATSRCKVSKTNCADIPGIKLKPSHSKSKFYNDVDWFKLSCPAGRKLENQPYVVTIKK
jgi:hypothetical protein